MLGENKFRIEHFGFSFKAKERRVTYKGEKAISGIDIRLDTCNL